MGRVNRDTKETLFELLLESERALTISELAEKSGITRQTASKYLEVLKAEGHVEVREVGQAKLHYPDSEMRDAGGEGV